MEKKYIDNNGCFVCNYGKITRKLINENDFLTFIKYKELLSGEICLTLISFFSTKDNILVNAPSNMDVSKLPYNISKYFSTMYSSFKIFYSLNYIVSSKIGYLGYDIVPRAVNYTPDYTSLVYNKSHIQSPIIVEASVDNTTVENILKYNDENTLQSQVSNS